MSGCRAMLCRMRQKKKTEKKNMTSSDPASLFISTAPAPVVQVVVPPLNAQVQPQPLVFLNNNATATQPIAPVYVFDAAPPAPPPGPGGVIAYDQRRRWDLAEREALDAAMSLDLAIARNRENQEDQEEEEDLMNGFDFDFNYHRRKRSERWKEYKRKVIRDNPYSSARRAKRVEPADPNRFNGIAYNRNRVYLHANTGPLRSVAQRPILGPLGPIPPLLNMEFLTPVFGALEPTLVRRGDEQIQLPPWFQPTAMDGTQQTSASYLERQRLSKMKERIKRKKNRVRYNRMKRLMNRADVIELGYQNEDEVPIRLMELANEFNFYDSYHKRYINLWEGEVDGNDVEILKGDVIIDYYLAIKAGKLNYFNSWKYPQVQDDDGWYYQDPMNDDDGDVAEDFNRKDALDEDEQEEKYGDAHAIDPEFFDYMFNQE